MKLGRQTFHQTMGRCAAAIAALNLIACGGEDATGVHAAGAGPGEISGPSSGPSHVYALSTLVWSDDGATGYVALSDTLDLDDVSLDEAREFSGYTTVAVADGQLLVTNAEDPTIHRYAVSDALQWQERGRLSLSGEGVTDSGFYRQYLRRGGVAYAELEAAQRVIWDPVGFEVAGAELDTRLPLEREGLDLFANFNRTYFTFDGPVLKPFSYHDQDWFFWAPDSQIVVYDPDTHAESSVFDAPCPGLDSLSQDERGRIYLSTWEYPALHALVGSGAAPCVVRVTAEGALDATWEPDLTSWTGGRHVVNFRYLRDGKAIAAVLHHEELGADFDFENAFPDQDALWAAATQHHRLWLFDLEERTAEPVRGLPEGDFSPYYAHAELDDRLFLMHHATDDSRTTVYELGLDGQATERFEVLGTSYQWVKLR